MPSIASYHLAAMSSDGSMRVRDSWRDPWILAGAGAALTIALLYGFLAHPLFNPDDYVRWAQHFDSWWQTAEQQPVMRTPGYPLFLALSFKLGLGNAPIIVIQALVLAATCVATAGLAGEVVGRRAARITAWGFAAYFPLLTYAGTAMTEVLATGLTLLAVILTIGVSRRPAQALRFGAGAALAASLAMIIHPNVAMYWGVLVLALLWLAHGGLRGRLAMLGVIAACTAVVFAPWVIRNLEANGRPAPFGDSSTYPLALGLHLPWDKTSGRYGSHNRSDAFFGGLRADGFTTQKARQTKPTRELKDDLLNHTGDFLESRALAVYNMWSYAATPRIQSGVPEVIPYGYIRTVQLLMVLCGALGLVRLRRTLFGRLGLALVAVTFVVELVYWANPRYVIPIAPYLLAGTGATLTQLPAWVGLAWQRRRRREARGPLGSPVGARSEAVSMEP